MQQHNKFKSLLIIFLLVKTCVVAQNQDTAKTLVISPYVLDKKVCVIFQNDSLIALTSTNYLLTLFRQSEAFAYKLEDESKLFMECYEIDIDTINLYSYAKQKSLHHLIINLVVDLIDKKSCVIFWKKTNQIISKILVKPYDHFDVGGMAYYVDEKLLFETIDRVY